MAKDITDAARDALTQLVNDATKNIRLDGNRRKSRGNPLSGAGGVAAGAGLAALAPVAAKGAVRMARRRIAGEGAKGAAAGTPGKATGVVDKATRRLGDAVGSGVGEKVKEKVDESGGVSGVAKDVGKRMLPSIGGGGDGGGQQGAPGVGKGRRMPVQQSMDVAVPIETAYNQWTQYEDWPLFMHRVTRVSQEDPCTVSFATKIWAKTKEFTAEIETQRPDERVRWKVTNGITHTGVVTFHELAPRLTRIELTVDVEPGSLLEKAARGMRHIKRAMRADLHRFKAYIEMQEMETGAWRGVIEDGELVEDHDPEYDEEREYAGAEASAQGDEDEEEGEPRAEESQDEDEEPDEEEEPEAEADEEEPQAEADEPEEEEPPIPRAGGAGVRRRAPARPRTRSGGRRSSESRSTGERESARRSTRRG